MRAYLSKINGLFAHLIGHPLETFSPNAITSLYKMMQLCQLKYST